MAWWHEDSDHGMAWWFLALLLSSNLFSVFQLSTRLPFSCLFSIVPLTFSVPLLLISPPFFSELDIRDGKSSFFPKEPTPIHSVTFTWHVFLLFLQRVRTCWPRDEVEREIDLKMNMKALCRESELWT